MSRRICRWLSRGAAKRRRSSSAAMRMKMASLRSASDCSSRCRRATNSSSDSEKYESTSSISRASAGCERPESDSRCLSSWSSSSEVLIWLERTTVGPQTQEICPVSGRNRGSIADERPFAMASGHSRWALIRSREEVIEMKLYYASQTRAGRPRWLLEEIGTPYEMVRLSLQNGDNRRPEYLAINPNGTVPALADGDLVLFESAAICQYLADKFPDKRLAPPIGTPARGLYYQWIHYAMSGLEPAAVTIFLHTIHRPEADRVPALVNEGKQRLSPPR